MKIFVNPTARYPDLDHVKINQVLVDLEAQAARVTLNLEDNTNEQITKQINLTLQLEEYEQWTSDDTYVRDWVLSSLSLTERDGYN